MGRRDGLLAEKRRTQPLLSVQASSCYHPPVPSSRDVGPSNMAPMSHKCIHGRPSGPGMFIRLGSSLGWVSRRRSACRRAPRRPGVATENVRRERAAPRILLSGFIRVMCRKPFRRKARAFPEGSTRVLTGRVVCPCHTCACGPADRPPATCPPFRGVPVTERLNTVQPDWRTIADSATGRRRSPGANARVRSNTRRGRWSKWEIIGLMPGHRSFLRLNKPGKRTFNQPF